MLYIIASAIWLASVIALCATVHHLKRWLDTHPPQIRKPERVPLMAPDDIA